MSINDFNNNYMTPLLEKTSCKNKTLVLLGDFNINLLKHDTDDEVSDFFALISCFFSSSPYRTPNQDNRYIYYSY